MKILFVDPHESSLFSFRKELVDRLILEGHDVFICVDKTQKIVDEYLNKVPEIIDIKFNLKDKNIFGNLKLRNQYKKVIKRIKPDLIISYKIKPNIYCANFAKHIPMIANITGLGNTFKNDGLLSKIGIFLYKRSFKNVDYIFFQNEDSYNFFKSHNMPIKNYKIIPGSGVNTSLFHYYPICKHDNIFFLFASRAIKEKGFELLIDAIPIVYENNPKVRFNFMSAEEDVMSSEKAKNLLKKYGNIVNILPRSDNMGEIYANNDFLVSPSFYREGISNVLLESLSCGRPIICTNDNAGCKEVLIEGVNGYGVTSRDLDSLVKALLVASNTPLDKIEEMGKKGRQFVADNFERNIVIKEYLDTIKEIEEGKKITR